MKIGDSLQKRCPQCNSIISGIVASDNSRTTELSNAHAFNQWQNDKYKEDRKWQGMDNQVIVWEQHYCPTLPRHPMERNR